MTNVPKTHLSGSRFTLRWQEEGPYLDGDNCSSTQRWNNYH